LKRFTAFFAPIFKNLWQTTPPDCCREQTGKIKKFSLRLPKRPLFTVVVVNSGQNTPPQSLYWWSKPVYPQTRAAEESGSFLEQDSTTVPKSAYRSFCPGGNLVGECLPQTLLMRLTPLENLRKFFSDFFKNSSAAHPVFLLLVSGHHAQKGGQPPMKRYNTPHRSRVVKTRLTDEEYADFTARLAPYGMSQSEFIRQAITRATIRPIVTVSPVNDELLAAVGKLTAEYGRIGGILNQIARYLNEYGVPYNALSGEVRVAISDLAALKFEVLQKVGEAVGNIQTYQL
jgi:hypothetical protein